MGVSPSAAEVNTETRQQEDQETRSRNQTAQKQTQTPWPGGVVLKRGRHSQNPNAVATSNASSLLPSETLFMEWVSLPVQPACVVQTWKGHHAGRMSLGDRLAGLRGAMKRKGGNRRAGYLAQSCRGLHVVTPRQAAVSRGLAAHPVQQQQQITTKSSRGPVNARSSEGDMCSTSLALKHLRTCCARLTKPREGTRGCALTSQSLTRSTRVLIML